MTPKLIQQIFADLRDIIMGGLAGRMKDPTYNDLAPHEGFLLEAIAAREPLSMKELSIATGTLPNTMTGVVDRLVKRGILSRENSEADRRIVLVRLTDLGKELHDKSQSFYLNYAAKLLDPLSSEERRTLVDLIRRIAHHSRI